LEKVSEAKRSGWLNSSAAGSMSAYPQTQDIR
jgi:hypothetical protein